METTNPFEKILNPDTLKTNLISISLFITAFELLKQIIIDKPQTMYMSGIADSKITYDEEEYKNDVLSRNKSPVFASLDWLQEQNIIDADDINHFITIKAHRNEIAHEMVFFVTENNRNLNTDIFVALLELIRKIEKNWFSYFEVELMPDLYENKEPDLNNVVSGNEILIQTLIEIAFTDNNSESS